MFVSHVLLPRFGPRITGLAVVVFAFALIIWVFAPNTTLFIVLAAPLNLAFGVIQPSTLAVITQAEDRSGRRLQPLHWASFSAGSLSGLVIGMISQALAMPQPSCSVACSCSPSSSACSSCRSAPSPSIRSSAPASACPGPGAVPRRAGSPVDGDDFDYPRLVGAVADPDLGLAIALGGTGIMAFNIAEIVSRLYGEALINRFGEVLVAGWGMILGCVIFLAAALEPT